MHPFIETIRYVLNVTNIENVVASHIHVGAAGTNGPVVAFLDSQHSDSSGGLNYAANACVRIDQVLGPVDDFRFQLCVHHADIYCNVCASG